MPRQKDFKRLVRARMRKTGEAYTTARRHLLEKEPVKKSAPNYAELAGMSDAKVKEKTGCTWERWAVALDSHGATKMAHRDVARLIHEQYKLNGWWAQTVTVGYERIKGLREKGQRRGGGYEATKSKTFNVSAAKLSRAFGPRTLARWLPEAQKVRTHTKGRSARVGMKDGAIAAFWFVPKGETKCALSVQQARLPDKAAQERVKRYWGERLNALGAVVS